MIRVAEEEKHEGPLGHVFAVGERPYCTLDDDHRGRTLEFLDGLDAEYFQTVASVLAEQLESDDGLAASVALRVSYHQGP